MTKPRILVTGAAGRNASAAVLELLRNGFPVRAFVRRNDARSERLRKAGAEIFVGDLFDLSDLRRALVRNSVEKGELEMSNDIAELATYLATEFRTALMLAASGHSRRDIRRHLKVAVRVLQ